MKQVLKSVTIVAMTAFLAGCDDLKFGGLMTVNDTITFAQDLKAFTPEENYRGPAQLTVAPGRYDTKAITGKSGSKKYIKLEIKNADKPTVVKLQFDKNINLGSDFTLAGPQINQAFDLKGTIDTKVKKSEEYSRTEHCTYQYPETVCRSVSKSANETAASKTLEAGISEFAAASETETPEASNPVMVEDRGHHPRPPSVRPDQPVCYTNWVSRPGTQWVRYYYKTTTRGLLADFVENGKTLASFDGTSTETEKIYTYEGTCH